MPPRIISRLLTLVLLGPPLGCAILVWRFLEGVSPTVLVVGYIPGLLPAIATAAISCMAAPHLPALARVAVTAVAGFLSSLAFSALYGLGLHVPPHVWFRIADAGTIAALICATLVELRLPKAPATNLHE